MLDLGTTKTDLSPSTEETLYFTLWSPSLSGHHQLLTLSTLRINLVLVPIKLLVTKGLVYRISMKVGATPSVTRLILAGVHTRHPKRSQTRGRAREMRLRSKM